MIHNSQSVNEKNMAEIYAKSKVIGPTVKPAKCRDLKNRTTISRGLLYSAMKQSRQNHNLAMFYFRSRDEEESLSAVQKYRQLNETREG